MKENDVGHFEEAEWRGFHDKVNASDEEGKWLPDGLSSQRNRDGTYQNRASKEEREGWAGKAEEGEMLTAGWERSSQACDIGRVMGKPKIALRGQLGLELEHSGEFAMSNKS